MRELAVTVPAHAAEQVLDRLLPLAPLGVHEVPRGDLVELRVRGAADRLPARAAIEAAAGEWGPSVTERELPDDWRARRVLDYEPDVVSDRIAVRPAWAPAAGDGVLDVVLEEHSAFGDGTHPTTRACLEELVALAPKRSLADLGAGSGVLAVAAALLGFRPVIAVESDPHAADVARANAARNGAAVEVVVTDLLATAPPAADTVTANVPFAVHEQVAAALPRLPRTLVATGMAETALDATAAAYARAGLREERRRSLDGWGVVVLRGAW